MGSEPSFNEDVTFLRMLLLHSAVFGKRAIYPFCKIKIEFVCGFNKNACFEFGKIHRSFASFCMLIAQVFAQHFYKFFFDHHMMHSEGVMGNRDNECSAQGSSVNGMDDETKTSSPYLEMGCYSADSSSWRPYPVW